MFSLHRIRTSALLPPLWTAASRSVTTRTKGNTKKKNTTKNLPPTTPPALLSTHPFRLYMRKNFKSTFTPGTSVPQHLVYMRKKFGGLTPTQRQEYETEAAQNREVRLGWIRTMKNLRLGVYALFVKDNFHSVVLPADIQARNDRHEKMRFISQELSKKYRSLSKKEKKVYADKSQEIRKTALAKKIKEEKKSIRK
eukprot:PhF_6_TR19121/c0_g1_i1/m.28127